MNRTELAELIHNGENSGVEFKRDDVRPEKLAKEMAALLNIEGGYILLGVEDDGAVSGLARGSHEAEEWVMETARTHLRPAAIPFWETLEWEDGKVVGIVSLPADAPDKPYKMKRGSAWMTQVRVGTTSRDATDEEEARLYMQSGRLSYDRRSVPGADFEDLDLRRLVNYFRDFRRQGYPGEGDRPSWERLLINTEIMVADRDRVVPSVAGLLLFGPKPKRFLSQAGISAVAYSGATKDYDARERATLRGPIVSLFASDEGSSDADADARTVETGVIEQALDFVRRNTGSHTWVDGGGQRRERSDYPLEALREAIVNAVAHRDYTISVMDIELSIYVDRLEVISPGRLPNTVTVPKMKAGYRASRNELVKEILRDFRYIEATGLGVPRKIVEGMRAHNGTEPDLVEEEDRFLVRLWKDADPA
ncbi:MAG TPA: ATP-binding protein [Vicinamibacteria bacterium]|jgi:ATP-dependent DNA helicase RecG